MASDRKFYTKLIVGKIIIITIVLMIFFVPFIPVESTVQVVCVATPCNDMIVIESQTLAVVITDAFSRDGIPDESEDESQDQFACIALFDPVCGVNGVTYSNGCFASIANVEVQFKGECGK